MDGGGSLYIVVPPATAIVELASQEVLQVRATTLEATHGSQSAQVVHHPPVPYPPTPTHTQVGHWLSERCHQAICPGVSIPTHCQDRSNTGRVAIVKTKANLFPLPKTFLTPATQHTHCMPYETLHLPTTITQAHPMHKPLPNEKGTKTMYVSQREERGS